MLESFRMPFDEALENAYKIGANGVQLYAARGECVPENLDAKARKELLKKLKDKNMVFSALCGDFGKGFGDPEQNKIFIEKSKRVIDLAKDLETNIVTHKFTKSFPLHW
jgi:sugar phosphate isomerase/epimerase